MLRYYIVSLPRTGTKSLCKMMDHLGFKVKHTPSVYYSKLLEEGYDVFADTPIFELSVIKELSLNENNKFIYIKKPVIEWIKSIEKVGLNNNYSIMMNYTSEEINDMNFLDIKCLGNTFGYLKKYSKQNFVQKYLRHREQVFEILSDNLLKYEFSEGWESLCQFTNKPIPSIDIFHLNKDTMFDAI